MKRTALIALVCSAVGCGQYDCPSALPIVISLDRSDYSDPAEFYEAAWYWNQALGFDAVLVESGGEVEVFYVPDVDCGDFSDVAGCALRGRWSHAGFRKCTILVAYGPKWTEQQVLRHEIGHCLGLDHDSSTDGVMSNEWHPERNVLQEYIDHVESCR